MIAFDSIEADRVKSKAQQELAEAVELLNRAARGGDASPGTWVQIVLDIAGFLSKHNKQE